MNPSDERIIGIDPGTRITGFGVIGIHAGRLSIIDCGCIKPPAKELLSRRHAIIFESLTLLLKKYEPTALAVETQYVHKSIPSAIKLGMTRGVIVLAATLLKIPVFEYAPSEAKKAVVGTGSASKAQVQGMIMRLLSLNTPLEPEDVADALALAVCHAHSKQRGWHYNLGI